MQNNILFEFFFDCLTLNLDTVTKKNHFLIIFFSSSSIISCISTAFCSDRHTRFPFIHFINACADLIASCVHYRGRLYRQTHLPCKQVPQVSEPIQQASLKQVQSLCCRRTRYEVPVNEPGPAAIAMASICSSSIPDISTTFSIIGRSVWECVCLLFTVNSAIIFFFSSAIAADATSPELSIPNIFIIRIYLQLYFFVLKLLYRNFFCSQNLFQDFFSIVTLICSFGIISLISSAHSIRHTPFPKK